MLRKTIITSVLLVSSMAHTGPLPEDDSADDGFWMPALPKCQSCPTAQQLVQPGVGFALEMGYGTAAVRWNNGEIQSVVQVEGSSSYKQLMRDLSQTTPETRFPYEFPTLAEKIHYVHRCLTRLAKKALGRPANQQTDILAEMVVQLQNSVEEVLFSETGTNVTHAVVTSPDAIRLTAEEVGDILDYLKIRNLMAEPDELYAASAAFAGYGHGLCKAYTDPYKCAREEFEFPWKEVLHLDFSDAALRLTLKGFKSFKRSGADASIIKPELGYKHIELGGSEILYEKIRHRIREFAGSSKHKLTHILLTGTRVNERQFKDNLKDALRDLEIVEDFDQLLNQSQETNIDFVFATARGAAEVAKRRLERPCHWAETQSQPCDSGFTVTGGNSEL